MQVVCPACGSSAEVSDEDWERGLLLCAGCGKRIRLRQVTPAANDDPVEAQQELEDFTFSPSIIASVSPPPGKSKAFKTHSNRFTNIAVVGALAISMIVVLFVALRHLPRQGAAVGDAASQPTGSPSSMSPVEWDRAHRAELIEMKSQADQLAIARQWQKAFEAYQRMIAFVGDHELTDPIAVQAMASARLSQDRVMQTMMTGRAASHEATDVAVTGPSMVASVTQPSTMPTTKLVATPSTSPSTAPSVVQLDRAQTEADNAPPLAGPAPAPPSIQGYALAGMVTDEQIGQSIENGVKFLSSHFQNGEVSFQPAGQPKAVPKPRGTGGPRGNSNLDDSDRLGKILPGNPPIQVGPILGLSQVFSIPGIDALCVYSLLHAGQALDGPGQKFMAMDDPFTQQLIDKLKSYNLQFTYHRSLRSAALAVFNRPQDAQALEQDVRWLITAGPQGAYTYTLPQRPGQDNEWDNSNSQYGLLGVWSGAQVGMAVSQNYWRSVMNHWTQCANSNGTFGYVMGDASTTMTCAGVASLLVARDYIDYSSANARMPTHPTALPALDNGLRWLEDGDNCITRLEGDGLGGVGYGLYGLERVGLASGFKYFGRHDWYSELAKILVGEQHFDGSWGEPAGANGVILPQTLIDTSYALLFLARGRHPILFNKLRYDGDWNDRPNDVSHLAKFTAHAVERPLNWQVVTLHRNWFDWMDCPVLYISGDKAVKMTPGDYVALRNFANAGGMIFTHADGGSSEFNKWVNDMVRIVFPKYELMTVPREHEIYSTVYQLKTPPPLLSISNASRVMMIHSPTDLGGGWQSNWTDEHKMEFQLGANIFIYAAGKGILKNRLLSTYIPESPDTPESTRQIARLVYASEWDPEPYAWTRFSRFFQWETRKAIDPAPVILKTLTPKSTPLAVLTGTVRYDFTAAECVAAKEYVNAGGVLMIDACGGSAPFIKSIENTLLPLAFPDGHLQPIPDNHPMLIASRIGAFDLIHPVLRSYANQNGGKQLPIEAMSYGKGWVIFSRLDVTTGLLGTQTWGILGYDPAYAQALMKNLILWAEARNPSVVAGN